LKILIAEDDLTTRAIMSAVVRNWGFEPIEAEDGEAAWKILQQDDAPRLLLLDWEMPNLDGIALCRRIRLSNHSDPPYIILLTARQGTNDLVKGLESGANDYVSKPFDNMELQARLNVGRRVLELQADLNAVREALAFQADHDELTGLLNRRAIMKMLDKEVARAKRHPQMLCVGLCDIDHFKTINDTYGHQAGDAILKAVALRFLDMLRPYDEVGRYGGEEFLVLLSTDDDQALMLFERLRNVIAEKPFVVGDISLNVTVSCGVTCFRVPSDERNCDNLFAAADIALYEAKDGGRNRTVIA